MTPHDIRNKKIIIEMDMNKARMVLDLCHRQLEELQGQCTHSDKYKTQHGWFSYHCPDCGKDW